MSDIRDELLAQLKECQRRVEGHALYNATRAALYDGKNKVGSLGISAARNTVKDISAVIGWPALVVDSLEERLDISDFLIPRQSSTPDVVMEAWRANNLDAEYSHGHLEAMIHGVAFLAAQPGGNGDPAPIITIESPRTMSGIWDPVRRDLSAAAAFVADEENRSWIYATLYTREHIARFTASGNKGWQLEELYTHSLGRTPVRRLVNRARTGRIWGQSEITEPIISATRSATRTLVRSEIASEFFSAPQRVIIGLTEQQFSDNPALTQDKLKALLGYFMIIPDQDDPGYQRPDVKQLEASSPEPFINLVRMYAQQVAGEAALPPSYLGYETANPSSADQIRAIESRHVKRAERKQQVFGKAWAGILQDGLALASVRVPGIEQLHTVWRDAATPTRAATTDAIVKQVQAGVLPATSRITYKELGYDSATIDQLVFDARMEAAANMASSVKLVQPGAGEEFAKMREQLPPISEAS